MELEGDSVSERGVLLACGGGGSEPGVAEGLSGSKSEERASEKVGGATETDGSLGYSDDGLIPARLGPKKRNRKRGKKGRGRRNEVTEEQLNAQNTPEVHSELLLSVSGSKAQSAEDLGLTEPYTPSLGTSSSGGETPVESGVGLAPKDLETHEDYVKGEDGAYVLNYEKHAMEVEEQLQQLQSKWSEEGTQGPPPTNQDDSSNQSGGVLFPAHLPSAPNPSLVELEDGKMSKLLEDMTTMETGIDAFLDEAKKCYPAVVEAQQSPLLKLTLNTRESLEKWKVDHPEEVAYLINILDGLIATAVLKAGELESQINTQDKFYGELPSSQKQELKEDDSESINTLEAGKESDADSLNNLQTVEESESNSLNNLLLVKEESDLMSNLVIDEEPDADSLNNTLTVKESDSDSMNNLLTVEDSDTDSMNNLIIPKESESDSLNNLVLVKESDSDYINSLLTGKESDDCEEVFYQARDVNSEADPDAPPELLPEENSEGDLYASADEFESWDLEDLNADADTTLKESMGHQEAGAGEPEEKEDEEKVEELQQPQQPLEHEPASTEIEMEVLAPKFEPEEEQPCPGPTPSSHDSLGYPVFQEDSEGDASIIGLSDHEEDTCRGIFECIPVPSQSSVPFSTMKMVPTESEELVSRNMIFVGSPQTCQGSQSEEEWKELFASRMAAAKEEPPSSCDLVVNESEEGTFQQLESSESMSKSSEASAASSGKVIQEVPISSTDPNVVLKTEVIDVEVQSLYVHSASNNNSLSPAESERISPVESANYIVTSPSEAAWAQALKPSSAAEARKVRTPEPSDYDLLDENAPISPEVKRASIGRRMMKGLHDMVLSPCQRNDDGERRALTLIPNSMDSWEGVNVAGTGSPNQNQNGGTGTGAGGDKDAEKKVFQRLRKFFSRKK